MTGENYADAACVLSIDIIAIITIYVLNICRSLDSKLGNNNINTKHQ